MWGKDGTYFLVVWPDRKAEVHLPIGTRGCQPRSFAMKAAQANAKQDGMEKRHFAIFGDERARGDVSDVSRCLS